MDPIKYCEDRIEQAEEDLRLLHIQKLHIDEQISTAKVIIEEHRNFIALFEAGVLDESKDLDGRE